MIQPSSVPPCGRTLNSGYVRIDMNNRYGLDRYSLVSLSLKGWGPRTHPGVIAASFFYASNPPFTIG